MPTALITGASGGIGLDLAREFASHGYDCVLVARSADKLSAAAEELRRHKVEVEVIAHDLSHPDSGKSFAAELAARHISVDVLVNNAGYGLVGRFDQLSLDDQLGMMHLNMTTLVALSHLVLLDMVARGKGRILNVASTAAFQPGPLMAVYYASKSFVLSFSEALWEELRGTGVTVTALCPGPVATGFAERAGATKSNLFKKQAVLSSPEVARAGYAACIAGKRLEVPGTSNKIVANFGRFVPKSQLLKTVRGLNSE